MHICQQGSEANFRKTVLKVETSCVPCIPRNDVMWPISETYIYLFPNPCSCTLCHLGIAAPIHLGMNQYASDGHISTDFLLELQQRSNLTKMIQLINSSDLRITLFYCSSLDFMKHWPVEKLLERPEVCLFHFFK